LKTALLALFIAKASIYILIKMLAIRGFALLASILFASFNIKVATILKSKRLVIILIPLYKN
jgi:hypothetical protein